MRNGRPEDPERPSCHPFGWGQVWQRPRQPLPWLGW